ncbi:hypothetical protein [Stenotrophomonas phage RAS14]
MNILSNAEIATALESIVIGESRNEYALNTAASHQAISESEREVVQKFQRREAVTFVDRSILEQVAAKIRKHSF